MEEYAIISEENMNIVQEFIVFLKSSVVNMATLHRNLVGDNWFVIHEVLGEYYEKLNDFEDEIVEGLIGGGFKDQSLRGSEEIIEAKDFTANEALDIAQKIFSTLSEGIASLIKMEGMPVGLHSVFDEFQKWLHVEGNYKLGQKRK